MEGDSLSFSFLPASIGRCNELIVDLGGVRVGGLEWDAWTGEVSYVWVVKEHQRQGIATALWRAARALPTAVPPRHSSRLTAAGASWVRALRESQLSAA